MTPKQRSFIIFQQEFLNHIRIMHPLVEEHEGIVKFKEMDKWFNYTNLPPSIEKTIKEGYGKTLYGKYPFYLQGEDFFATIPFALFNSAINPEIAEFMNQSDFSNWKIIQEEGIGGYYGLVDYDNEGNIIPNAESERWGDEEGNYGLFHDNPEWDMELIPESRVYEFVRNFNSDSLDIFERTSREQGFFTPYSKRLLKSVFYNSYELIQSHINGHIALHSFGHYVNQKRITLPPYFPKVYLRNLTINETTFTPEQQNYFDQALPAGIEPHNENRRYYLPQDYLDTEFYHTESLEDSLQFKCEYLETQDGDRMINYPAYSISSVVSTYYSETKEISLSQIQISALAAQFGYEFEDFCQAVLCKNLGFWLTQDLCSYPTQWFLRIEMEFLHFYSDYFANILCENENQKNILALLALLGTSEHQAYYRTPIEIVSERTSEIIDNLPSLRTDWKPHKRIEDIDKDDTKEIRECLKSFIPFDENKKQRPEHYKLREVLDVRY
ncbi:MAG: hypothetical protein P8L20_06170 [Flavobacteriales bacterium]|nr:hypothetical protein [Flavobacteriales bacterium]